MTTPDVEKRAQRHCEARGYSIDSRLGVGTQGSVYVANIPSQSRDHVDQVAIKFHDRANAYDRELGVFLRLQDLQIDEVCGHMVPQLIGYNDDLPAIEMTIVSPPFCLDFGGAYLDRPPDYSPEVWADWEKQKSGDFEDNWTHVKKILAHFAAWASTSPMSIPEILSSPRSIPIADCRLLNTFLL